MTLFQYNARVAKYAFCAATLFASGMLAACATPSVEQKTDGWVARGYLYPFPNGDGEVIGVFETEAACLAAGEAWMSRQVVGMTISRDCTLVGEE